MCQRWGISWWLRSMLTELCQDTHTLRRKDGIGSRSQVLGASLFRVSRTVVSETDEKDRSGSPLKLKGLPRGCRESRSVLILLIFLVKNSENKLLWVRYLFWLWMRVKVNNYNEHLMHSRNWVSHRVKCDSYCFTGFWDRLWLATAERQIDKRTPARMHAHPHTRTQTHTQTHTRTHARTHIHTHTHDTHTHTHTHTE